MGLWKSPYTYWGLDIATGQVVLLDEAGRRDLVERQAKNALERAEASSKSRQAFLKVSSLIEKTKAIVHTAVSACPPAAVAWSVACLFFWSCQLVSPSREILPGQEEQHL
jgi:hypothetical protein